MQENPYLKVVRTPEEDIAKLEAEVKKMQQHNATFSTPTDKDYFGIMPFSEKEINEVKDKINEIKKGIELEKETIKSPEEIEEKENIAM